MEAHYSLLCWIGNQNVIVFSDGGIVTGAGEADMEGVMEGEEGGGWEVSDDDLDLPPDLVSQLVTVVDAAL